MKRGRRSRAPADDLKEQHGTDRPRTNMPEHFGIRIVSAEKDKVVGEIDADERHLNNRGIVHGGAYMAFADDLGGTPAGLNKPAGHAARRRSNRRAISSAPRRRAG